MRTSNTWRLVAVILLALVALYVDVTDEHPEWVKSLLFWRPEGQREIALRLGLDLQGGLQVLLAANPPAGQEVDAASMETARRIVENRVNALGLTEPVVQAQGERRIIVELPGIEDPEQAVETIKGTALLEFVNAGYMPLAEGTLVTTTLGGPGTAAPTAPVTTTPPTGAVPQNPAARNNMYGAPPPMQIDTTQTYTATILTAKGNIVVQLDAAAAPQTVNNFVFLSEQGFYSGLTFHRVEPSFVIQGGDPLGNGSGGPGYIIPAEIGLSHVKGAIAMARLPDDVNPARASSGSQFYIALEALPGLDGQYTVFGHVTAGMDVVQSIAVGDVIERIIITTGVAPTPTAEGEPTAAITPTAELSPTGELTPTEAMPPVATAPGVYETILTGAGLTNVDVNRTQEGKFVVTFDLKPEAATTFGEHTSSHIGQYLCIVLDKKVISCPVIRSAIVGGSGMIEGNFTLESARQLALQLRYGALPVPLRVESFNRVGATLGHESVERSVRAGIIGLSIVLFFMLIYYRLPGGLADLSLIIYVLLNFALYKLAPVTLTLPGIAGFLLSVGMAVDANILIFERMKEELRRGRSLVLAIEAGFSRAWTSIRDSQLSTLIICAILFFFGSNYGASIVKGFAITLAIGTAINIFTAVFVTRIFLRQVAASANEWLLKRKWLLGV